jgi:hypothetical protein
VLSRCAGCGSALVWVDGGKWRPRFLLLLTVAGSGDVGVMRFRRPKWEIKLESGDYTTAELQDAIEEYDRRRERTERDQRAKLLQKAYHFATRRGRHVNGPLLFSGGQNLSA